MNDAQIAAALDELEQWLGQAVGDAFTAALEVEQPAGSSPDWRGILERYGASPTADEERSRLAAATGMLRGVPADELYEVLDRIHKDAEQRFERIGLPDDNALDRRRDRLQGVIGRLRDETLNAYRKRIMPKRSMFGAAMASARAKQGQTAAPAQRKSESFVMRCEKCGAPRLQNDVYVCEYCDTPYA